VAVLVWSRVAVQVARRERAEERRALIVPGREWSRTWHWGQRQDRRPPLLPKSRRAASTVPSWRCLSRRFPPACCELGLPGEGLEQAVVAGAVWGSPPRPAWHPAAPAEGPPCKGRQEACGHRAARQSGQDHTEEPRPRPHRVPLCASSPGSEWQRPIHTPILDPPTTSEQDPASALHRRGCSPEAGSQWAPACCGAGFWQQGVEEILSARPRQGGLRITFPSEARACRAMFAVAVCSSGDSCAPWVSHSVASLGARGAPCT